MKQLTSDGSIEDLLLKHEHSLLYFSASWCGPCRTMSPIVESISNAMNDQFNIIKVDVDNSSSTAADYGVRSVPTMMLVKHNEIIDQRVGVLPPQKIMQWLEQYS